jgi:phosphate:Na+ symporter
MSFAMAFGLIGGLALFIMGMRIMGDGLQKTAGDRLRHMIEVLTSNPLLAVVVGALVTAVVQSSSATTVMVVGFVNGGLMTLRQAVGIIMGANIGTTITAQIIAFQLDKYALPAIALGVAFQLFGRRRTQQYLGEVLFGFGILFLGMGIMKDAMGPLQEIPAFSEAMTRFGQNPALGAVTGFAMTGAIQSSSATIGMLQALAGNGLVSLKTALPILFGDNVGTTVTAMLSSVGTNLTARRAALVHFMFNLIGATLFLTVLPLVEWAVVKTSSDIVRQIANAHTMFNVINVAIQLPFAGLLVAIVHRLLPGEDDVLRRGPQFLDKRLFNTPSLAVTAIKKELYRMGQLASDMLAEAMRAFQNGDQNVIQGAYEKEDVINELEKEVTRYVVVLSGFEISDLQSNQLSSLIDIVNDIERVGDHAENILELAEVKCDRRLPLSESAHQDLRVMYERVDAAVKDAIQALWEQNDELALRVVEHENEVDAMERDLRRAHIGRLNAGTCHPESGVIYLDVLSNLERIADHASSIAHEVLEFSKVEEDIWPD